MKEIGGYLELDEYHMTMLYEDAIHLNCGRSCLAYLIEARNIKKIYLPYFICNSVIDVCKRYNIVIQFYNISENFLPLQIDLKTDEWLYIVNYYGQLTYSRQQKLVDIYKNVIIDNSQAYFSLPLEHVDILYTCRKFFGVSDGAILYSDAKLNRDLERDKSYDRIHFVLGRYEQNASDFFKESSKNNDIFDSEPIKIMSKLTYNLLHAVDYNEVKKIRTQNWKILNNLLGSINELNIADVEGGYMYPLMIKNAPNMRAELIKNKIYIPILWQDVMKKMPENSVEYKFSSNILPIPCDQRYDVEDMLYMTDKIKQLIK